jgi:hypothetical protein
LQKNTPLFDESRQFSYTSQGIGRMTVSLAQNENASDTRRLCEFNYFPGRYQLTDNDIPVTGSPSENPCASTLIHIPPSSAVVAETYSTAEIPELTSYLFLQIFWL